MIPAIPKEDVPRCFYCHTPVDLGAPDAMTLEDKQAWCHTDCHARAETEE